MSGRRAKEKRKLAKDDIRSISSVIAEAMKERLATLSFEGYIKYINRNNKDFKFTAYIKYLCDTLDRFERGEIKRLAIFMPPQHGKSVTISQTFVSYFMMKDARRRVMVGCYGDDLAKEIGEANLKKILEFGHMFGVSVSSSTRSKSNFRLNEDRGGLFATSMRGAGNGMPADLLVIDDPIKGPSDLSAVSREEIHRIYREVFRTRLSAHGQEIMILTRWHLDDLAGRVVDENWEVVELPLLSLGEDEDILKRPKGQALFPEIGKNEAWAAGERKVLGERTFQALYQQNPRVEGGDIIKEEYIRYYKPGSIDLSEFDRLYQTWDLAMSNKVEADYNVGQLWGLKGDRFYLLDMVRGKWKYETVLNIFDEFNDRYGEFCYKILIENKANGINLIADRKYVDDVFNKRRHGDAKKWANIEGINPVRSKRDRVEDCVVYFEQGLVYLPEGEDFTEVLVDEALGFGSVKNDDAIDACVQMLIWVRNNKLVARSQITAKPRFRKFV